jgi:hypothetical protein
MVKGYTMQNGTFSNSMYNIEYSICIHKESTIEVLKSKDYYSITSLSTLDLYSGIVICSTSLLFPIIHWIVGYVSNPLPHIVFTHCQSLYREK